MSNVRRKISIWRWTNQFHTLEILYCLVAALIISATHYPALAKDASRKLITLSTQINGSVRQGYTERMDYVYGVDLYDQNPNDSAEIKDALSRYKKDLQKRDVVILSLEPQYVVDQPILSNGGDVIIVANKVVINAPIDTRPFIDHSGSHFEARAPNCYSVDQVYTTNHYAAYQDFFQKTSEIWDEKKQSYSTTTASAFPEMPSGFSVCALPKKSSTGGVITNKGFFPVDHLVSSSIRPGDIRIYTNEITVCPNCLAPDYSWDGRKPECPECDGSTIVDRTLLNARGLRGSRGFPGHWGCYENEFDCGPPKNTTGGAPRVGATSGGQPGNVIVSLINNPTQANTENDPNVPPAAKQLAGRISTAEGEPAGDQDVDVQCKGDGFFYICADTVPDRRWFVWGPHAGNKPLGAGDITIRNINADSFVTEVGRSLMAMEIGRVYTYEDLLSQAARGDYLGNLSPLDQFDGFLYEAIRQASANLLDDVLTLNTAAGPGGNGPYSSPLFFGLGAAASAHPGLGSNENILLERLSRLSFAPRTTAPISALQYYFILNGGLVSNIYKDPTSDQKFLEIMKELKSLEIQLGQILDQLIHTRYDFFEYTSNQDRQRLQANIKALQDALQAALAKANDDNDIFKKIPKVLDKVQDAVTNVVQAYKDFSSDHPERSLGDVGKIVSDVGDVRNILSEKTDPSNIQRLLDAAQKAYDDFEKAVAITRQQIIELRNAAIQDILTQRRQLNSMILGDLVLMEDLIRAAVFAYQSQALPDRAIFERNVNSISRMLGLDEQYPVNFVQYALGDPVCDPGAKVTKLSDLTSTAELIDCVEYDPVGQDTIVWVKGTAASFLKSFPALVLKGNSIKGRVNFHSVFAGTDFEVLPAAIPLDDVYGARQQAGSR